MIQSRRRVNCQDAELRALQECKRLRAEVRVQRVDEEAVEGPDSEARRLRQQLLTIHNDLRQREETRIHHTHTIECLQEEKKQLEKEYETQPKPVEVEKQCKSLRESCEELRKEISQRRLEARSLTEDVEAHRRLLLKEQRQLAQEKDTIERHEAELAQLLSVPGQLGKEIERISRKKAEVLLRQASVEEQLCSLCAERRRVQERSVCVEQERREVLRELEGRRAQVEAADREHALLLREHLLNKEKEVILLGHRGVQEMSLSQVVCEQKRVCEALARGVRERDRQLRSLKKAELTLRLARDALTHTQALHLKTKAEQRFGRIKEEVRAKDLMIQEHKKQNMDIQSRLGVFAKMYEVIKGERNKCVLLIQTVSRRLAEMKENMKILENELDILHTTAGNKDRLLQKCCLRRVHAQTVREALWKDMGKSVCVLRELTSQREEQKLRIARLTHLINVHETQLLHTRKAYDTAVQARNDRGVQLLEREEEVCIFYEKLNVQERVEREGSVKLQELEEEARFCQMAIKEETRLLLLAKNLLPCKRSLEQESTMLQIELSECKDRIRALERTLEDPTQPSRVRELEGADPMPLELMKKIEELEKRLCEREEQLLERELVLEQVGRLCQPIRAKAANGKHDTMKLAKKMSRLQVRIKEATHSMMALVAELSMRQAATRTLQQAVHEREQELDMCLRRVEQGLPPSSDTQTLWIQMLQQQRRKDKEQREKEQEEEDRFVFTTAVSRPNAYIPPGDTLPLPRPYGGQAPFMPSQPGASMRHIRKPQPKPIQI
ncbi:hypothetical protein ACEWY4_001613 [Coilia grayii]|uniref:Coiled-coil domain-containing protein 146 n=1 Tax=Coilia grayii TaxID=363190 RepID=A0ABD1KTE5_9TELE